MNFLERELVGFESKICLLLCEGEKMFNNGKYIISYLH